MSPTIFGPAREGDGRPIGRGSAPSSSTKKIASAFGGSASRSFGFVNGPRAREVYRVPAAAVERMSRLPDAGRARGLRTSGREADFSESNEQRPALRAECLQQPREVFRIGRQDGIVTLARADDHHGIDDIAASSLGEQPAN